MPFKEGNQLAKDKGRKGYEFEEKNLERMTRMLEKYLKLVEQVLDDKDNNENLNAYAKLSTIGADMRKILDKLHASKTESDTRISGSIEEILKVDSETQAFINEYKNWRKAKL